MRKNYEHDESDRYVDIKVKQKGLLPSEIEAVRRIVDEAHDKIAIAINVFRKPNNELPELNNGK